MELVNKDNNRELSRLSRHALPRKIHAKLAAAGRYEDSFIKSYGEEAYDLACQESELRQKQWNSAMSGELNAKR